MLDIKFILDEKRKYEEQGYFVDIIEIDEKKSKCPCCTVNVSNSNLGKIQRFVGDKVIKYYLICKSCSESRSQSDITNSIIFREFWILRGKSKLLFT